MNDARLMAELVVYGRETCGLCSKFKKDALSIGFRVQGSGYRVFGADTPRRDSHKPVQERIYSALRFRLSGFWHLLLDEMPASLAAWAGSIDQMPLAASGQGSNHFRSTTVA